MRYFEAIGELAIVALLVFMLASIYFDDIEDLWREIVRFLRGW